MIEEYTDPEVFTTGVKQGWAETETDPARIDWAARRRAAAIPFEVVGGRPVAPWKKCGAPEPPVRYGRNGLGLWGESRTVDALVAGVDSRGARRILMVERRDHGASVWALPGGFVDPGESLVEAALRELAEETLLSFPVSAVSGMKPPRYVPDPRGSWEAWVVTTLFVINLGQVDSFPSVVGSDDARRAAWVRAHSFGAMERYLDFLFGGTVYSAHVPMLRELL